MTPAIPYAEMRAVVEAARAYRIAEAEDSSRGEKLHELALTLDRAIEQLDLRNAQIWEAVARYMRENPE
jgi:hypothetical protein